MSLAKLKAQIETSKVRKRMLYSRFKELDIPKVYVLSLIGDDEKLKAEIISGFVFGVFFLFMFLVF